RFGATPGKGAPLRGSVVTGVVRGLPFRRPENGPRPRRSTRRGRCRCATGLVSGLGGQSPRAPGSLCPSQRAVVAGAGCQRRYVGVRLPWLVLFGQWSMYEGAGVVPTSGALLRGACLR